MAECYFIEPWQVEHHTDALILREQLSARDFVFGGIFAFGLALVIAAVDYWLWRRQTIGGAIAALLCLGIALIAAKGFEQFFLAWRTATAGPRSLRFRRGDSSVTLEGFPGMTTGDVQRIEVVVENWESQLQTPKQLQTYHAYQVVLIVNGQRLQLGTYAAESSANRLAGDIASTVGITVC